MARLPRLDVPGIPQHVIQRGNNRIPCFVSDDERLQYLYALGEAISKYACDVHAYVLMSNHVHLLMTGRAEGAVSQAMQSTGRRYVRHFNRVHKRTGTLFEGRFRSSLVETERYLLTCHRYIELNPVRAGIVANPRDYRWSSYACNALGIADPLVVPSSSYLELGDGPASRQVAYRYLFQEPLAAKDLEAIRLHVNKDCALGSTAFQATIEARAKRRAGVVGLGRPKKS